MEDSFEKRIRETMDNPPDFPFEEEMWKKLATKLDRQDATMTSANRLSWWWLLLAALLPGLLAGWLLINRQQDQQKISLLEEQVARFKKENTAEDTPKRVMVIYDTIIHKTVVIQPSETTNSSFYTPSPQSGLSSYDSNKHSPLWVPQTTYSTPLSSWSFYADPFTSPFKRKTTTGSSSETELIEERKITPLVFLPNKWYVLGSESDILLAEITPTELKKRRRSVGSYLSPLRPDSWSAAAGIGVLNGVHLSGTNQRNVVTAGELEIGYGRHWRLGIGIEQLNINFSVGEDDVQEFDFFTPPPPNNPDDEWEGLSAAFNYWQLPLSINYRFGAGRRTQPYIGLGIIGVIPTTASINYEFEDNDDNKYNIIQDNLLPREIHFSDAFGLLGVQYQLSKKWYLWTEFSGQRRWQEGGVNFQQNQFIKAIAGLKYRF